MPKIPTITRHSVIVLAVCVLVAIAIPLMYVRRKTRIEYRTFHTTAGWGYDILVKSRILIHQEYVPTMAEKKGFASENVARKAAGIVVDKLENNKLPTLSSGEINQICQK